MVEKLESLADAFRDNGYTDEASTLQGQVEAFREVGVPEDFLQEEVKTELSTEDSTSEKLLAPEDLKEARARIVSILSAVQYEHGKLILTPQLAEKINVSVGQYLGDEVRIEHIRIPSKSARTDRDPMKVEGFEGFKKIDTTVRSLYNRLLNAFIDSGYQTLGKIRNTDREILLNIRNIGETFVTFVETAFARPRTEKQ